LVRRRRRKRRRRRRRRRKGEEKEEETKKKEEKGFLKDNAMKPSHCPFRGALFGYSQPIFIL